MDTDGHLPLARLLERTGLLVAAMGVAGVLVGCGSNPVSTLRMPGTTPPAFGQTIVAPPSAPTLSVGDMSLCVEDGSAIVTAVRFDEGDLPITAFGVRPLRAGEAALGYMPGDLSALGFPKDVAPVTGRCRDADKPDAGRSELAISVGTPDTVVKATDLVITYDTPDGQGELTLPLELKVCPPSQPASCQQPGG